MSEPATVTRRPRVVVTHPLHDDVLALLEASCDVIANQTPVTPAREEILARARDADALIVFMPDRIDRAFLERCPRLRVIAGALRGFDNFDVEACTERGVWFTVVPELLAGATAELGVGMLVALGRRLFEGDAFVRSGRFVGWQPHLFARGVAGRSVGIAGMGQLGRAVARRLAGFEAVLTYGDLRRLPAAEEVGLGIAYATFDRLLRESDYLLLALPLAADTLHTIDARALAHMRPGACIVNLARGSLVDENAVAAALASGHLGGYAADVYELEDWARDDRPRTIPPALLADRNRTVLTPHLGSAVATVRRSIERAAAESALQALRGERPDGALNEPRRTKAP